MHSHSTIKYDPNLGSVFVRIVSPTRGPVQLDLRNDQHGLIRCFTIDPSDLLATEHRDWKINPSYLDDSQHGRVIECWGQNGEFGIPDGAEFDAAVEVSQAGKVLGTASQRALVKGSSRSFKLRIRLEST